MRYNLRGAFRGRPLLVFGVDLTYPLIARSGPRTWIGVSRMPDPMTGFYEGPPRAERVQLQAGPPGAHVTCAPVAKPTHPAVRVWIKGGPNAGPSPRTSVALCAWANGVVRIPESCSDGSRTSLRKGRRFI